MRRADVRFLLPRLPSSATILGAPDDWGVALTAAGIEVRPPGAPTDVVIAGVRSAHQAVALACDTLLVLGGRAHRPLRTGGYYARTVLAWPGPIAPVHLVPVGDAGLAGAAFGREAPPRGLKERLRDRLGPAALGHAIVPWQRVVTVGVREVARPQLLQTAEEHGLPRSARWWLSLGQGDPLQRAIFHVLSDEGPDHVVKFARVPGYRSAFERDAEGLELAARAGRATAATAPRLQGRFEVAGLSASVETRAPGRPLHEMLCSAWPRARRLALIDVVSRRLLDIAVETAEPAESLAAERVRLESQVAVQWPSQLGVPDLVRSLPPVPGVLVHNDAGTWNILADADTVTLVDWESARRPGLPLWDLLYFLADALVLLDEGHRPADPVARLLALFRGELASSPVLFRWVRQAVSELALPQAAVGSLAALAWLHHGCSPAARTAAVAAHVGSTTQMAPRPPLAQLARPWMADPALGAHWRVWQ